MRGWPDLAAVRRILPTPVFCWDVQIAEGNEGLNDTGLPSFASYANSSAVVTRHGNLSCPVISGHHATGGSVRLSIDPSYLGYSHCVCVEGMEVWRARGGDPFSYAGSNHAISSLRVT